MIPGWTIHALAAVTVVTCALADEAATQPATQPATTQPAATQPAPPDADPRVVAWLDRLEKRGEAIRSYQADVVYDRRQMLLGDRQTRFGKVTYFAGPPARFRIDFDKLVVNRAARDKELDFIFDGKWLLERQPAKKLFIKRQVVAPGRKLNPLRLGEGPFPLPLGQKRDEVLAMFELELIAPGEDDPENTVHLQLTPREDEEGRRRRYDFTTLDLWFNRETMLPARVITTDESENVTKVTLRNAKVNELAPEKAAELTDTATPPPGSGWRVEITPWQDGR